MSESEWTEIGAAILDESFPDVDMQLRRGRHIDREDNTWYAFLTAAQAVLEPLYRRFGCELVHKSDGYFYLLPTTDQLGKRQLSIPEMLVGQALALLYLDPRTLQSGGNVARQEVLAHLAAVMGTDALLRAFNPKKKRLDERVAQETVRSRVAEALRKLATLGFVELLEGEQLHLRAALMRFAEPVRGLESPLEALQKLVAKGEVVLQLDADEARDGATDEVDFDSDDSDDESEPQDDSDDSEPEDFEGEPQDDSDNSEPEDFESEPQDDSEMAEDETDELDDAVAVEAPNPAWGKASAGSEDGADDVDAVTLHEQLWTAVAGPSAAQSTDSDVLADAALAGQDPVSEPEHAVPPIHDRPWDEEPSNPATTSSPIGSAEPK